MKNKEGLEYIQNNENICIRPHFKATQIQNITLKMFVNLYFTLFPAKHVTLYIFQTRLQYF